MMKEVFHKVLSATRCRKLQRGIMQREGIGVAEQQALDMGKNVHEAKQQHAIWLEKTIAQASIGFDRVDTELIIAQTMKNCFDGISLSELQDALILGAVTCIERDPAYGYVAARLLLGKLYN